MKRKNYNKVVITSIIVIVIIILVVKIRVAYIATQHALEEDLPTTFTMLKEDSLIIKKEHINKIKVIQIRNSTTRRPVSELLFDNKYSLFIYKIDTIGALLLKDSLNIKEKSVYRTTGIVYTFFDKNFYKFQYKTGTIPHSSFIYLTMAGDSIQQYIKNDSIVGYDLSCKNLSIRYGEHEAIDIYIEAKENIFKSYKIPMSFLFLKRQKETFLLIMTTNNYDEYLPKDLLYSLINTE